MKAAVFHGPKQPLVIEDVEIDTPQDREVLVRTVASGVCHSDLHFVPTTPPTRPRRPISASATTTPMPAAPTGSIARTTSTAAWR